MRNQRLRLFLILTFAFSTVIWVLIIGKIQADQLRTLYGMLLMWCPGIAAMITTRRMDGNLRALGWRAGKPRYLLESYLLPVVYAGIAYGLAYMLGLARFTGEAPEGMTLPVYILLSAGPLFIIGGLIPALGEEIGWRGFLNPELRKSFGFLPAALITGAIWSLWHYPLILSGQYTSEAPLLYNLVCFTLMAVGISVPFAWLRERSGSLWTATVLHASHNIFVQQVFDVLTADTGSTAWITGEFGAALAVLALVVAGVYLWRYQHQKVTS